MSSIREFPQHKKTSSSLQHVAMTLWKPAGLMAPYGRSWHAGPWGLAGVYGDKGL